MLYFLLHYFPPWSNPQSFPALFQTKKYAQNSVMLFNLFLNPVAGFFSITPMRQFQSAMFYTINYRKKIIMQFNLFLNPIDGFLANALKKCIYKEYLTWILTKNYNHGLQCGDVAARENFIVCDFVKPSYPGNPPQVHLVELFQTDKMCLFKCPGFTAEE